MTRKFLLATTASLLCATGIAFAQDRDSDTMAAELNAQQLEQFRAATTEGYVGQGDIDTTTTTGPAIEDQSTQPGVLPDPIEPTVDPNAVIDPRGEGDIDSAGDAIEDATDDAADAVEDAADATADTADKAADSVEDAADDIVDIHDDPKKPK